jgi:hypothetical protein
MPPIWSSWSWSRSNPSGRLDRYGMARYQIILAYDGTHFQGFQRQANARTVQEAVTEDCSPGNLGWQGRKYTLCREDGYWRSRCGSGDCFRSRLETYQPGLAAGIKCPFALGCTAVREVRQVAVDFHPRFWAVSRRYQYRIFCQEVRNPLWSVMPGGFGLLWILWNCCCTLRFSGGKQDFAALAPRFVQW